jgi:CDP-6-deoxy-D-xylo-4-hexulose-3-dehydrase
MTDLGLDLNHLESLLKDGGTAAVFVVHVLGHSIDMDELIGLCDRYGVMLVEDACEALGTTSVRGKSLGSYGLMGTYSFYYGHQISTIEGGMLITNDKEISIVSRSLRAHGWSRDVDHATAEAWEFQFGIDKVRRLYSFYYPGFNCRSTDLNAYLGLGQLARLTDFVNTRQRNFERYVENLSGEFWTQRSAYTSLSSLAFGTFVENREDVFDKLNEHGIESRPLICGSMGRQPFWIKIHGPTPLPNADIVHNHGIYLPNHSNLSIDDVDYVCDIFSNVARPLNMDIGH